MRLQHLFDPSVEALDHAVGLGVPGRGQAMVDPEVTAEQVELVLAGGGTFAQIDEGLCDHPGCDSYIPMHGA